MSLDKELLRLQKTIVYTFDDIALLKRAVTHRSDLASGAAGHMERLEFLGDAVLGLVIAEHLHHCFPDKAEGKLSRMRANLVCRERLLHVEAEWRLQRCLIVGDGERGTHGIKSPSIAANAVEAVIGAVFEDGGWEQARRVVLRSWKQLLTDIDRVDTRDAKSRLQELTQAKGWGLPVYTLTDRGVDAHPRFEAVCSVQGQVAGQGRGERKKLAEIAAAEQAWSKLNL